MARVSIPASDSSRAVPPVETISTPSSESPRAKSTRPRLSETVSRARRTRTAPGPTTSCALFSVVPIALPGRRRADIIDLHPARVLVVDPHPALRDQPHRLRQQAVLDLVDTSLEGGDVTRIRNRIKGFLQEDRPAVNPLVDEVDRDPHHPHPVLDRLLDRVDTGKGRKERRVDVHDPAGEAAHEVLAEQLHEP